MSKCIADKFKGRTDKESVDTLNELQGRLRDLQEHIKAQNQPKVSPQQMPMQEGAVQQPASQENEFMWGGFTAGAQQSMGKANQAGAGNKGMSNDQKGMLGSAMGSLGDSIGQMGEKKRENVEGEPVSIGDSEQNQMVDQTKDSIASAFGPIGQIARGAQKMGQGIGKAIGGEEGAAVSSVFSPEESTMANLQDPDLNVGEKILGTVPGLGGVIAHRSAEKKQQELLRQKNLQEYNRGKLFRKYGGELNSKSYELGGYTDYNDEIPVKREYNIQDIVDAYYNDSDKNKISINGDLDSFGKNKDVYMSKKEDINNDESKRKSFNPMEALRYASPAMNIAQLAGLKKPKGVNLERIDGRYNRNYVDEKSMQNMARESALNTRDALMSAAGGSGARASANLLASQTLANKGMSDAYFKSKAINAAEEKYAQEFNMRSDVRNLMQSNQETAYDLQREAAYKQNKSDLMAAIGNDLSGIGKEEMLKKYPELMGLGYDWRGRAIDREDIPDLENKKTSKTSGEEKKRAEAASKDPSTVSEDPKEVINKNDLKGQVLNDFDIDESSGTTPAASVEGTNKTPNAGTKKTIKQQQAKKAEEVSRVAPQIYAPGVMELPLAGSYPQKPVDNGTEKEYIDPLKKKQKTKQGPKPYVPPASNITSDNMPIIDANEAESKSSSPSLAIDEALKFPWERGRSTLPVSDKKENAEAKTKSNEIIETDVKDFYGRNVKINSDIKPQFDTVRRLMKERNLGDLKITDSHVRSDVKEAAKKKYDKNVSKFKEDGFYLNHEGKKVYKMPPKQAGKKSFHTSGRAFDLNQKEYNPKSDKFKLIKHLLISSGFKQHPGEWWHFSIGEFDD